MMNPTEISDALEAIAAKPFDPETFGGDFAEATDNPRATVSKLRSGTINRSDVPGGMLHNLKFHFAPAAPGEVEAAMAALRASRKTERHKPAILIATDGETVSAEHRRSGDAIHFPWSELGDHFGFLLPAAGKERYRPAEENPVDVKAAGKLSRLYDALMRSDPAWAAQERRHAMNQFMTRLVFCLFAEDVGVIGDRQFSASAFTYGGDKGEHGRDAISTIFAAMARKAEDRAALPAWARALPYVNGGLFGGEIDAPAFDVIAWRYLRDLSDLDWGEINPDIFGSMIQSVADPAKRSELGMHYTSVPNIMKALGPLFLDELDAAIEKAWDRPKGLRRVLERIARIRVFDPACGSGNFLVVAYRELRAREARILARIHELTGQVEATWSAISLAQFFGIEIDDFAAETAKLALFIAEAQANARHAGAFGAEPAKLPLKAGAKIVCGNALRLDWEAVCPPPPSGAVETDLGGPTGRLALDEALEVFIVGNPPFVGKGKKDVNHLVDLQHVLGSRLDKYGYVDYVGCWFILASDYIRRNSVRCAFVATNSICQGRQVDQLWPYVFSGGIRIAFAHTTFLWRNSAAANAAVQCVVVGLETGSSATPARLFKDGVETRCLVINRFLVAARDIPIVSVPKPIHKILPPMLTGSVPNDGGNLILRLNERNALLAECPEAEVLLRRFAGSEDFIKGLDRWCLLIADEDLPLATAIPSVVARLERVRALRLVSKKAETRETLADVPHRFQHIGPIGGTPIIIPSVSSERRPWFPVGVLESGSVVSNLAFVIRDAPLWCVALIASRLHLVWIATVCGKLKSDYRYSNTLGWNTFPVPDFTESQFAKLEASARAILRTRYGHHPATIAELYDPKKMPEDLRDVHRANDELLEAMYVGRPFRSDAERLEHLFKLYAARVKAKEAA